MLEKSMTVLQRLAIAVAGYKVGRSLAGRTGQCTYASRELREERTIWLRAFRFGRRERDLAAAC
jgi:hypothetical protein